MTSGTPPSGGHAPPLDQGATESGQRVSAATAARFDAGSLSCSGGLARELRRRLQSLHAGDVLEVVTADPAAREDVPALARLLGHAVRSMRPVGDRGVAIRVEVLR